MQTKLLPCPYCGWYEIGFSSKTRGCEPGIPKQEYPRRDVAMYCKGCNSYGPRTIIDGESYNGSAKEGYTLAAAAWNRRTERS